MRTIFAGYLLTLLLMIPTPAMAGDVEERVERLERENIQLKETIKKLQERLDRLEHVPPDAQAHEDIREKESVATAEPAAPAEKNADGAGGIYSVLGKRVRIGGELEIEYRDTQNEADHPAGSTDSPSGQFQIDKLDIDFEVELDDDITLFAQVEAEPGEAELDEAHVTFSKLPLNSYLRAGLQKRFMKPSRKTETYPLGGTAFWKDKDIGLESGGEFTPFYYRLSLTNGLRLSDKEIGEDESFEVLQDDDDNGDFNNSKQVGVGIGLKEKLPRGHEVDLLGFAYFSRLSDDDVTFLRSKFPGYASSQKAKNMAGGNLEYKFGGLTVFGQYIHARDGGLTRSAWYVQPSYELKVNQWKHLRAIEALYRYGRLEINHAPVVSESLTWDRQRHTLALIAKLIKGMKLKLEYNINLEDSGGPDVRNNEFVGQLETKF